MISTVPFYRTSLETATLLASGFTRNVTIDQDYSMVIAISGPNSTPSASGTATSLYSGYCGDSNYNYRIGVWIDAKAGTIFRGTNWTMIIGIK